MSSVDLVRQQLRKIGVTPDKAFGQNFIIDPAVIDTIINFGRPRPNERVVEIGPGLGALTRELASIPELHTIEIEEKFARHIEREVPSATVHHQDIRFFELESIGDELTVFGNLPYSFSSEILFYLLDNSSCIRRAILLLQREFAERVASPPGSKAYGVLSVRTQLLCKPKLGPIIPGDIFYPPATVESRLLELRFYPEPLYAVSDLLDFKQLLAITFGSRRRKILNSLVSSGQFSTLPLEEILQSVGIRSDERVEQVTVAQFAALSNALTEHRLSKAER